MSTTTPAASRVARRKVASTTYVAPCRRCAGPNTSPRRLWAIIMWSRTVTLNTALAPVVRDRVTERRQAARGEPSHHVGKLAEGRLPGDERVEGGVAQQVEGERQPVGRRAAGAPGRGERADLAGADAEPTRVERSTQRQLEFVVAVPAEVDDRALGREQLERPLQPGGRRAGVHDQIAPALGVGRQREADPERGRDVGPAGIDVDERDLHRREPA